MLIAASCALACVPRAGPQEPVTGGTSRAAGISLDPLSREQFIQLFLASHLLSDGAHDPFACSACTDPMTGKLPPEALIDGPADVWN